MGKDSGLQSAIRLYLCVILQVTWWLWQPYRSSGPASTTWGLSDVPDRSWALLGLATVGLSSCLGNFWASAGVARMGGCWEIFFYIWEAIQDCVLQPLWCWDINLSLPLSLSLSLSLSLFLSLSLSLWVSLNWWSGTERKWLVRMPSRTSNGGGWGGGSSQSFTTGLDRKPASRIPSPSLYLVVTPLKWRQG